MIAGLPAPQADGADPAAGYLATLGGLDPRSGRRAGPRRHRRRRPPPGWPRPRDPPGAGPRPDRGGDLAKAPGPPWPTWPRRTRPTGGSPGTTGLASWPRDARTGPRAAFSAVYDELPGELAPKLALGFAAEAAGDAAAARYYFQLVWTVDRSYVSAAFGLARACLAGGDRPAAIAALAAVPDTSSHHAAAQIAAVRSWSRRGAGLSAADLRQADGRLGRPVRCDNDPRRHQLTVEILRAALDWVTAAPGAPRRALSGRGRAMLGCEPNERALRFGLERGYRALARLIPDRPDRAGRPGQRVRPRTWI